MPARSTKPAAPGTPRGYAHPAYAQSLAAFGEPFALDRSRGWLLRRPIPGAGAADAMGCYPLFSCPHWEGLSADLQAMEDRSDLVSVTLVVHPFHPLSAADLAEAFPDACRPFKAHHIVSLAEYSEASVDRHHRRNARWAGRCVAVERVSDPEECLETWVSLYDNLIHRHDIRGIARFSRDSFAQQFAVPGLTVFRAVRHGQTVGMALWYREGADAFYHLAAYSEAGYQAKASFAIFQEALAHLRAEGVERVDLGGGAGRRADDDHGLNRFKRGWANATRPAWLFGRVLDADRYARLAAGRETTYFPAYREGEFA